ncbi:uncharacterized protein FPRO_16134 [Fusarium proliferatum ET1]|uniref:F-box domain-containing protein n=1 Tax=Fusarium proliferatum (strain ET1) TaxID=1227346 RepID=A0A1L7WBR5_FUSPR|nr:uncharacterized protein FPRO_16134 [Fusarium proliferatum ET1]CZR49929.1 uncharacterized protein FPRO_16134 [Fusarium proliferatum ET1]
MPSLEKLPREVLCEILKHLHDGFKRHRFGGYDQPVGEHELKELKRREYLISMRAVNRLLCGLATPVLF